MFELQTLLTMTHQIGVLLDATPTVTPTTGVPVPAPMTDPTGTNTALENLAKWGAGLAVGFLMIGMVWQGLQYMMTHDLNRSTQLKLAAIGLVGGFTLVLLSINLAPEFLKLILGG